MSPDSQGDSAFLNEWNTARGILSDTDNHLQDLRKYSFTFITALLTTESFLIPTNLLNSSNAIILPPEIKLVVIGVTIVLLIALYLMDRNYQVLQEAAATRALVLERIINLELTEVITQRFNQYHVKRYVTAIYDLFISGVVALAWVAMPYGNYLKLLISVVAAVAFLAF